MKSNNPRSDNTVWDSSLFFRIAFVIHIAGIILAVLFAAYIAATGATLDQETLFAIMSSIAGILAVYYLIAVGFRHLTEIRQTHEIHEMELNHRLEKQKAKDRAIELLNSEKELRNDITQTLSQEIGDYLSRSTQWLDRASENLLSHPYRDTIFFQRQRDFRSEKSFLGQKFAKFLVEKLIYEVAHNEREKIYLVVDSGTTFVHLMHSLSYELADACKDFPTLDLRRKVRILTNNLAGVEAYLFPDGKEISLEQNIPIHTLPGRPRATTRSTFSPSSGRAYMEEYLESLVARKKAKYGGDQKVQVISILTARWVTLTDEVKSPSPVRLIVSDPANEKFKKRVGAISDATYVLAPLTKIIRRPFSDPVVNKTILKDPFGGESRELELEAKDLRLVTTSRPLERDQMSYLHTHSVKVQGMAEDLGDWSSVGRIERLTEKHQEWVDVERFYGNDTDWKIMTLDYCPPYPFRRDQIDVEFPQKFTQNAEFLRLFDAEALLELE